MQADYRDLDVLLEVQALDVAIMQAKKARAELPQRIEVVKIRKKRDEIAPKLEQVADLQAAKEAEIAVIEDEDRTLAAKQERAQADIDGAGADYRAVESHSKDMAGIVKRRVSLEESLRGKQAELDKIKAVRAQVEGALAACDKQEASLRSAYKEEDDGLVEQVRRLLAQRAELASRVPAGLMRDYDATAAKAGGVAIGRLEEGGKCGVCRVVVEGGRLIELRSQAPLGRCPNCKRLLIIDEQ